MFRVLQRAHIAPSIMEVLKGKVPIKHEDVYITNEIVSL